MNSLGKRIISVRCDRSREDFAGSLGVHRNTLAKWESDAIRPDDSILHKIASENGVTLDWLLNGFSEETPSEPSDVAKPPTRRRLQACNTIESSDLEKNETPTVGGFSTEEFSALQRELREQDKELRDLLRQTGDLRVENAELRARVRDLERELREALKPEEQKAPVAHAG